MSTTNETVRPARSFPALRRAPWRTARRTTRRVRPRNIARWLWVLPLELRFLGFSLLVLVVGALVIGGWVSSAIRNGVVDRSGEVAALYVESFMSPELQDEPHTGPLRPAVLERFDTLLDTTGLGDGIVSFKVWSRDGAIRYATDSSLVGARFDLEHGLAAAFSGAVVSHISNLAEAENRYEATRWDQLLETYAPIRSVTTGEVIAVAEFYQLPDDLLADIRGSQRTAWIIVGVATLVMFLLLNGLVRNASRTIRSQTKTMQDLTDQARRAGLARIETDEEVFRRMSQDLHDGPVQGLALATLRIDAVQAATRGTPAARDADLVARAVETSLAEVRQISTDMRLPDLRTLSLSALLRRAADEHHARTGERAIVQGLGGERVPSGPAATTIFRVVAEALANAARHAGPGLRRLNYDWSGPVCRITVSDHGRGFDPATTPEGLGLRGMRERVALLGGRLSLTSRPGIGTRVELFLPDETS